MIIASRGNILLADADALVNTVNTVGVMGKGLALQFRRAYPDMFEAYARAVKAGEVHLGSMNVWPTEALDGPRYVINFPTKGHWRAKSRLSDIEAGLADLVRVIRTLGITSVAVPPLGAGNGGLAWSEVEPVIRRACEAIPEVNVLLYAPAGPPPASAMPTRTHIPALTVGRAALISLLHRYIGVALTASPLEVQKLMYFMQRAGQPLRLRFVAAKYGPYADNLRHVLKAIEGHYVVGFGDGSAAVLKAEPINLLPDAASAASRVLVAHPEVSNRVERVAQVIEGFESMYGLELIASVDWIMARNGPARDDVREVVRLLHEWTPRKRDMFTEQHIEIAWERLRERQDLLEAG